MTETRVHPLAWLLWLVAADVAVLMTRNPLYLLLLGMEFALVRQAIPSEDEQAGGNAFLLGVIPLAAMFNALLSHSGETVLFRLPDALPLLGGAITLEALLYGAINGLGLTALFLAFAVFNRAVTLRELLRFVPRTMTSLAVVVSIAVTYIPATRRRFRQIREAQAIRGHRVRGWRDWLPLLMPLLIGGLEQSLHLAEALAARGFAGSGTSSTEHRSTQRLLLAGLAMLFGGTWLKLTEANGDWLLLGAGLCFGWLLWRGGQRIPRTTYHRHPWRRGDTLIALGAWFPLLMLALLGASYTPYPAVIWPPFAPEVGLALLGYLVPLWSRT